MIDNEIMKENEKNKSETARTREVIENLRKEIRYLKDENTALKSADSKIIAEPIKVAESLIYEEYEYENNPISKAFNGKETGKARVYSKSELRQIAEHLLVYCNSAEE